MAVLGRPTLTQRRGASRDYCKTTWQRLIFRGPHPTKHSPIGMSDTENAKLFFFRLNVTDATPVLTPVPTVIYMVLPLFHIEIIEFRELDASFAPAEHELRNFRNDTNNLQRRTKLFTAGLTRHGHAETLRLRGRILGHLKRYDDEQPTAAACPSKRKGPLMLTRPELLLCRYDANGTKYYFDGNGPVFNTAQPTAPSMC